MSYEQNISGSKQSSSSSTSSLYNYAQYPINYRLSSFHSGETIPTMDDYCSQYHHPCHFIKVEKSQPSIMTQSSATTMSTAYQIPEQKYQEYFTSQQSTLFTPPQSIDSSLNMNQNNEYYSIRSNQTSSSSSLILPTTPSANGMESDMLSVSSSSISPYYSTSAHGSIKYDSRRRPKTTSQLPERATSVLNGWFKQNEAHPYPDSAHKRALASECGITVKQVNSWFCNRRNRSQNTKPKRIKKQLTEEMKNIYNDLYRNPCDPKKALEGLRKTLKNHDIDVDASITLSQQQQKK